MLNAAKLIDYAALFSQIKQDSSHVDIVKSLLPPSSHGAHWDGVVGALTMIAPTQYPAEVEHLRESLFNNVEGFFGITFEDFKLNTATALIEYLPEAINQNHNDHVKTMAHKVQAEHLQAAHEGSEVNFESGLAGFSPHNVSLDSTIEIANLQENFLRQRHKFHQHALYVALGYLHNAK